MHADQGSLITRDDTLLGVCAALGEDFGFNPLYLRMALGVLLIWIPVTVIASYIGAGLIVAASRWAFPKVRPAEQANHEVGLAVAA